MHHEGPCAAACLGDSLLGDDETRTEAGVSRGRARCDASHDPIAAERDEGGSQRLGHLVLHAAHLGRREHGRVAVAQAREHLGEQTVALAGRRRCADLGPVLSDDRMPVQSVERAVVIADGDGRRDLVEDPFAHRFRGEMITDGNDGAESGSKQCGDRQTAAQTLSPPDRQIGDGGALKIHHGWELAWCEGIGVRPSPADSVS